MSDFSGEILSLRERLAWAMRDADGPNWEASGHDRGDYFRRQADAVLDALGLGDPTRVAPAVLDAVAEAALSGSKGQD